MNQILWKESYSIGINAIDEQHKKLIEIINELYKAQKIGTSQTIIKEVLHKLTDYTIYHFTMEEEMQVKCLFPKLKEHKEEHAGFVTTLNELKKDSDKKNLLLSLKTLDFLKDWTIIHILGSDREFADYLRSIEGA